jgi:hypothetical protein
MAEHGAAVAKRKQMLDHRILLREGRTLPFSPQIQKLMGRFYCEGALSIRSFLLMIKSELKTLDN